MRFDELIDVVGDLPWFDLATMIQLSSERRASLVNQLSRWSRTGKVIPLRRGMYAIGERYRKVPVVPAALASALYHPSSLSTEWALSFHGVIPEGVRVLTSVTTRSPRRWVNDFGEFVYRHVRTEMLFGNHRIDLDGQRVVLASPEKALVDLWYLEPGEWTDERIGQLRLAMDLLNRDDLEQLVARVDRPRVTRAFEAWCRVHEDADEEIEL